MRNVREPIRLKYEAKLSHEQIAGALAPRGDPYVKAAEELVEIVHRYFKR